MNRKTPSIIGAAVGLALFLAIALLPALLYGGYAGVLLAGGIFGTPIQATFLVRFAVGSKTEQTQVYNDVSTGSGVVSSNSCGGASCWSGWDYGWYGTQTTDVQTRKSGVVVDLVDLKSGTLAWRGIYAKEATGKVPTQEAVQEAVDKLFAKLPAAK